HHVSIKVLLALDEILDRWRRWNRLGSLKCRLNLLRPPEHIGHPADHSEQRQDNNDERCIRPDDTPNYGCAVKHTPKHEPAHPPEAGPTAGWDWRRKVRGLRCRIDRLIRDWRRYGLLRFT